MSSIISLIIRTRKITNRLLLDLFDSLTDANIAVTITKADGENIECKVSDKSRLSQLLYENDELVADISADGDFDVSLFIWPDRIRFSFAHWQFRSGANDSHKALFDLVTELFSDVEHVAQFLWDEEVEVEGRLSINFFEKVYESLGGLKTRFKEDLR